MARKAEHKKIFADVDLSVPIKKGELLGKVPEDVECFGKEWDMTSKECPVCSMSDICGIFYQDVLAKRVTNVEKEKGPFLDQVSFDLIDKKSLYDWCKENDGKLAVEEFVLKVKELSKSMDEVAIFEWIKTYKAEHGLKFRGGIVWIQ